MHAEPHYNVTGAIGYTMEYDLQICSRSGPRSDKGDAIAHIDVIGQNILNEEHDSANG